jgi:hypothetical protein
VARLNEEAIADFIKTAMNVNSRFSTAFGNNAIASYQVRFSLVKPPKRLRLAKTVLRKYPNFTDVRAALDRSALGKSKQGEAESNWFLYQS